MTLKGNIIEDKDFILMLAHNIYRLKSYQSLTLTKAFPHLPEDVKRELLDKMPCDIKFMDAIKEALKRMKSPIHVDNKNFDNTEEEVKDYLYN